MVVVVLMIVIVEVIKGLQCKPLKLNCPTKPSPHFIVSALSSGMQDRFLRVKDVIQIYYKLTCCLTVVQSHSEHLPKSC